MKRIALYVIAVVLILCAGVGVDRLWIDHTQFHAVPTHYLRNLPEYVDNTSYEVVPGITVKTVGMTVYIKQDPKRCKLGRNDQIKFAHSCSQESSDVQLTFNRDGSCGFSNSSAGMGIDSLGGGKEAYGFQLTSMSLEQRDWSDPKSKKYAEISVSVERNGVETEWAQFNILCKPYVNNHKGIAIAADRLGLKSEMATDGLGRSMRIIKHANRFITMRELQDPDSNYRRVNEVVFFNRKPHETRPEKSCSFHADLDGVMLADSSLIGTTELDAGLVRECMHCVLPAMNDAQKEQVYAAYQEYRSLQQDFRLMPIEVFKLGGYNTCALYDTGIWDATGMLGNMVGLMRSNPETIDLRLAKLSPAVREDIKTRVIRPCLKAFGPEWGPKFVGPKAYQHFMSS